ncbi:unnamed protein product [Closterium sp. NIES-53]
MRSDIQHIVSAAMRDAQAGTASQSGSQQVAPSPTAPPPGARPRIAPQQVAPPPAAPAASAPALGGEVANFRCWMPWVPPVAGMEFVGPGGGAVRAHYPPLLVADVAAPAADDPLPFLAGGHPPGRDHFLALEPTDLTVDLLEKHLLAAETSVVALGAAHGTPRTPFFEGCSPSPLSPPTLLLLLLTSLVPRTSGLLLFLVGSTATARARVARVVAVAAGVVVVAAREAVEVAEVAMGVVVGVGASVAAVVAAVGVVVAAVVADEVEMFRGEVVAVARGSSSSSSIGARPPRPGSMWFARDRAGQTCGKFHTQHRCFSRLDDAWRAEFGDEAERPRWLELLRSGVDIFALNYDAILAAMYALAVFAEGACYLCVPLDPGIEAAALGASESSLPGTVPAEALHTFTLGSGASRCFFHDSTTLTPLPAPVPVTLADPSEGPVLARSSTVLPCLAVPSGSLSGLHLPSFSTNLDRERYFLLVVDDFTRYTTVFPLRSKGEVPDVLIPWIRAVHLQLRERFREDLHVLCLQSVRGGEFSSDLLQEVCHGEGILHSFTLPASPQKNGVAERRIGLVMEVARTSMIHAAAPHFLWPFVVWFAAHQLNLLPRVSLPKTSPTLRWTGKVGDALVFRVKGSCVSQVDPLPLDEPVEVIVDSGAARGTASGGAEPASAEPGGAEPMSAEPGDAEPGGAEPEGAEPRGAETEGAESGGAEPKGAEHGGAEPEGAEPGGAESEGAESEGGESGGALPQMSHRREPLSPQQLREWFVQRTRLRSGVAGVGGHAAGGTRAGGVGDASCRGAEVPAGATGTGGAGAAGACGVGGAGAEDPGVGGTGARDPRDGGSGARGAGAGGAGAGDPVAGGPATGGTGAGGAGATSPGGAGVIAGAGGPGGAGAAGPGGARTRGTGAATAGGIGGTRAGDPGAGGTGAGDPGAGGTGAGDPGAGGTGAGDRGAGGFSAGGAGAGGAGAGGARAGGRAGAGDPRAGGAGTMGAGAGGTGTVQWRPFFVPLQPSSLPPPDLVLAATGLTPSLLCPPPHQSQPQLQPNSPLLAPSPYAEQTDSLTERREPESRPAWPVRTIRSSRRVPCPRPPPIPSTHIMALRPSSVPLRVPMPSPPASSLANGLDPECDLVCAVTPIVPRLLATVVTDPLFESAAASALVAELVDFAAACYLDYAASLVAESESDCPLSIGGECAVGTDVPEDKQEDFECLAAAVPHFVAMLHAHEGDPDAPDISTPRSYAEVKRPPGSPPFFKARYVARGFSQRQGFDFFHTFSPTPKTTTLRVQLHIAPQRDYELHSLDFRTTFLQGSLHEEIWLRRPPGITRSFPGALGFAPSTADPSLFLRTDTSRPPFCILVYVDDLVFATADTEALALVKSELQKRHNCTDLGELRSNLCLQITRDRARCPITFTQSHMVHQLVGCLMHLVTCTQPDPVYPLSILARYVAPERHREEHWETAKRVLRYLCSLSGMGLVLGGRGPIVLNRHTDASWVDDLATQRSSQGYTFSLDSGSVSWRSTYSSSVLSSNCEAKIYAGAMATQELRWRTYLQADLGERPRSSPVLYVENKAMIALYQEHKLEHKTKNIAQRYFLARELQQRDFRCLPGAT